MEETLTPRERRAQQTREAILDATLTAWSHVHGVAMLRVTTFRHLPIDWQAIDRGGLAVLLWFSRDCGVGLVKW